MESIPADLADDHSLLIELDEGALNPLCWKGDPLGDLLIAQERPLRQERKDAPPDLPVRVLEA